MGRQLHIPSVKCFRVESNFDEKKISVWRTISTKTFHVSSKKTVSRFIRHPNGLVSRLNTDELLLAASASCNF